MYKNKTENWFGNKCAAQLIHSAHGIYFDQKKKVELMKYTVVMKSNDFRNGGFSIHHF